MKRLILAGIVTLSAIGATHLTANEVDTVRLDCSSVRCAPCPEGTVFAPEGNNCCRCKKI